MDDYTPDGQEVLNYLLSPLNVLTTMKRSDIQRYVRGYWPQELAIRGVQEANRQVILAVTNQESSYYGYYIINYLRAEIHESARNMNGIRNNLMGTTDRIDSYDIYRGIYLDSDLKQLLKYPRFYYDSDPNPDFRTGGNLSPGADAAFSAYLSQVINTYNSDQVRNYLLAMKLDPNGGTPTMISKIRQIVLGGTSEYITFPILLKIIGLN